MQKVTRRHVISTLSASSILMCPALLNAQSFDWGEDIPTDAPRNADKTITLGTGETDIDVTDLQSGQIAVVARATDDPAYTSTGMTQYIAIMRRTDAQISFGADNDQPDTIQDPRFFVANLICPHRGNAIGMTGNPDSPFACTKRGGRHDGVFDASGLGTHGGPQGDYLSIPNYTITITETDGTISQAVVKLG